MPNRIGASRIKIQEEDASPSGFPLILIATPNGKLTDNEDGSFTLDVSGAGYNPDTIWKSPAIIRRDWGTPPESPEDKDRYIISAGTEGAWYSESGTWLFRQEITINPDSNKVPASQSNFPVPVIIDAATNHIFGNANSTGFDILFTSSDKLTKLDHEIEHYDET